MADAPPDTPKQPASRALKLLILLLCLIAIGLIFATTFFEWYVGYQDLGARDESDVLIGVTFALIAIVGALGAMGQPRNATGWLLLCTALATGVAGFSEGWTYYLLVVQKDRGAALIAGWLGSIGWLGGISLLLLIFPFLFPNGRLPSARWRPVFAVVVVLVMALMALLLLAPLASRRYLDPNALDALLGPFFALFPAVGLLGVGSLVARFRHADGQVRQQTKWLALTVGAPIVFFLVLATVEELTGASFSNEVWGLLYLLIPLGLGISLLRYKLFDVDTIIRKTAQYTIVTVLLALVYFGVVVLLQRLFSDITGQTSTAAVVLSTLAIAALFNPVRRRVQAFIDRRFYRRKYDAEQVLAQFAATARDETDLDTLTAELVRVIQETMQPESVTIWLAESDRETKGT